MAKTPTLQSSTFRLPIDVRNFLIDQATQCNTTQVDILVRSLKAQMIGETQVCDLPKYVSGGSIKINHTKKPNDEVMATLVSLGVGTTCGIVGYHLSGVIRQQWGYDEDKGTQMIIGLGVGILGLVGASVLFDKKK